VAAQGTYNFVSPWLNTEAQRQYIAPTNYNTSNSNLWQAQAILGHKLADLSGGPLQLAAGLAYRKESINNPSANPANLAKPFDRYYSVNAVGAVGSRNVKSAFFELGAPVIENLELNITGRFDKYSSGQSNFSPKAGFKFKPIPQVAIRGTWSKGFRIPSFNESYGLPTTGYSSPTVNCTTYAAFCAAHANNAYATTSYSLGRTQIGNPGLKPEKSTSYTLGAIIEPNRHLSLTVDYYKVKVKDLIGGIDAATQTAALDQYFRNNGVVSIPGIAVKPQIADVAFPAALPLPGFIEFSFTNTGSETVEGLDFGLNTRYEVLGWKWVSKLDATYVMKYQKVSDTGVVERYDGTLSPCDYTSCSGTPKWRGSLENSFTKGKLSLNATVYYTAGYDLAEVDYGAVAGDCLNPLNSGNGSVYPLGGASPIACKAKATWNLDVGARFKVNDHFTIYGNILNVLGIDPPLDTQAAYSIYQYNPSWAQANAVGRYFRVGAKVDF
jgi:iron complex outermembrane recepter protein